eukprot:15023647-Alexandrium_andersonii.AAC.1
MTSNAAKLSSWATKLAANGMHCGAASAWYFYVMSNTARRKDITGSMITTTQCGVQRSCAAPTAAENLRKPRAPRRVLVPLRAARPRTPTSARSASSSARRRA